MNTKLYWKLRKMIQNAMFLGKKILYRLIDYTTGIKEYKSFRRGIFKYLSVEIVKGILLSLIILKLDNLLLEKQIISAVDKSLYVPSVIGGIGIAGVILGAYCGLRRPVLRS